MLLTAELLKSNKACWLQYHKFVTLFPNGVKVTVENAEAVANKFDWWSASEYLLGGVFYTKFAEQFKINCYPIHDEMRKLWNTTDIVTLSDDEYREYKTKIQELQNTIQKMCARAFAELWIEKYGE